MIAFLVYFFAFFKIGVIGFGGGYAIISIIMQEAFNLGVTPEQFADLVAFDLIVPGPIAINAVTFVGYVSRGVWGSVVATLAICAPCYIIVLTVMFFLEKFKKSKIMEGVLYGIRPAAIGLIAAAALTIGREIIIKPDLTYASFFGGLFSEPLSVFSPACLIIFLAALLCLWKVKVNPIIVTLAAGIAGAILVR